MTHRWTILLALAIAACSKANGSDAVSQQQPSPDAITQTPSPLPATGEQIAYSYSFDFQLPRDRTAEVQRRHIALCDSLGSRCRIMSMARSGSARDATAKMELAVAANTARRFGDALATAVDRAGGEVAERSIEGENLTKRIVDVEAHLRGRQALADRLLAVVQTRQGGIADLVAAQKALAEVEETIDTARSELAAARGRVAMSTVQITYVENAGLGGFTAALAASLANFGTIAGTSMAALLTTLVVLAPWLVLFGLGLLVARWWRHRTKSDE